ncbi:hypothetical protein ACONUD_07380 [Microbulbifer harenosus]|uniref:Uncharacterized protein n=1 Tax=Microbulbifer harenosus TaxID=2576840 RepID=A0ABY2UKB4_9GAMM|nr:MULTISPECIES: hypothetical protein [Microbulbifer]QIL90513.1 hypothetical protein GNX18_12660 [Microbulbifer sp. SH-1]TLM77544.1 hypothetical protein FDY93_07955 [Microbulbifer harenosus]
MKIVRDTRLEEFKRIEDLLYGINYEVWFNLYGPTNPDVPLEEILRKLISENCRISDVVSSSPQKVVSEIMEMVFYDGDKSAGPLELESKKAEIAKLLSNVFTRINIEQAESVAKFEFKKGHPAYPVFWDFACDIQSKGQRWVFIGSSSD